MNALKDYYSILEVEPDATKEEIRAAYRRLAKQHHPDISGGGTDDERFKEINEANGILSDENSRSAYDELRETLFQEAEITATNTVVIRPPIVRQYERKFTAEEIHKIYLTGVMRMKYWAEETSVYQKSLYEQIYELHPTDVLFYVRSTDIFQDAVPPGYQARWACAEVLRTPLKQPVQVEIADDVKHEFYELNLEDIRIDNPNLIDISKIENENLGTLEAGFYGYTTKIEQVEKSEWIKEYSGSTGRFETKTENNRAYTRYEHYEKNGSTSWGPWTTPNDAYNYAGHHATANSTTGSNSQGSWKSSKMGNTSSGQHVRQSNNTWSDSLQNWLLGLLVLFYLVAFLRFIPALFALMLGLLVLALFGGILSVLRRFAGFAFLAIALTLIGISLFTSHPTRRSASAANASSRGNNIKTTLEPELPPDSSTTDLLQESDTLIQHKVKWFDYDSLEYDITLAIKKSVVKAAAIRHAGLYTRPISNLGTVYESFAENDDNELTDVYSKFDTIRIQHNLNRRRFAEMIVSFVQSIPYSLIVDGTCSPESYADQYIKDYLRTCNSDCCVGGVTFGVRSPVEFLYDLKGDCDTRALFIYAILTHFKYEAAIITSDSYKHAALAVNVGEVIHDQESILERNRSPYYFWETTAKNFGPGMIPKDCNNLSKWQIKTINK